MDKELDVLTTDSGQQSFTYKVVIITKMMVRESLVFVNQ